MLIKNYLSIKYGGNKQDNIDLDLIEKKIQYLTHYTSYDEHISFWSRKSNIRKI